MKKLLFVIIFCFISATSYANEPTVMIDKLSSGSLTDKQQVISQLMLQNDPKSVYLLQSLANGELYWYKKEGLLVIKNGNIFIQWDNNQPIKDKNTQFKRININNNIRQLLVTYQLQLKLNSTSNPVRRAAATALFGKINTSELITLISQKLALEKDNEVQSKLIDALAFTQLDAEDDNARLLALSQLSHYSNTEFKQKLQVLVQNDSNPMIKQQALTLLNSIEQKQIFYNTIEQLFFGLSLGSILVLAAIGLAITFGVMGVINMAHGELIMLGAYTTYVMQQLLPHSPGLALILSIPMAFIVCGLIGIIIERSVIRFLYGRPLETLLATFGISLLLQQLARTIFSPLNKAIIAPSWMQGSLQINDFLSLTVNRIYILVFSIMIFLSLLAVMKKTTLGLNVRAISMNPLMARSLGVKASWVNALTFGLGSGIAGLAGVALSQITNVGPNLGQNYIIDSFMVVVFGGVGNLWGTFISGLILGLTNKFIEPVTGAMLAKIVILIGLVLFIQIRPRGLFPQRGRMVEN